MPILLQSIALAFFIAASLTAKADNNIFPAHAQLEELWNDGDFTEGVAVRADGRVFFSDIARDSEVNGRIMQFDPQTKKTSVFISDSHKSNGLFFNAKGQLLSLIHI